MVQPSNVIYFIFVYQPFSIIITYLFAYVASLSLAPPETSVVSPCECQFIESSIFCEDGVYKCGVNNRNSGCEWVL